MGTKNFKNYMNTRALASTGVSAFLALNAAGDAVVKIEPDWVDVANYGTLSSAATSVAADANAVIIQAALDAATDDVSAQKMVRLPPGVWRCSTIFVPEGIILCGAGAIGTSAKAGTRLVQSPDGGDVIRFRGHVDPANGNYYWYGTLRDFSIFGDTSAPDGFGVNFYEEDGTTAVRPQDSTIIRNIIIRRMPDGGFNFPAGALPLLMLQVELFNNNGPGITFNGGFNQQGIHFADISGDGNNGGVIRFEALVTTGNILITNLKSEMRVNADYGSTELQQNAIVIASTAADVPITILGATHVSSVPDGGFFKKPGDFIKLEGSNCPHLEWSNVAIRVRGTDTGSDPYVVAGASIPTYPVAIPYTVKSGTLSGLTRVDRVATTGYFVRGRADSHMYANATSDIEDQLVGLTPMRSVVELDADADEHNWLEGPSGGNWVYRTSADDGTLTTYRAVNRDAGVARNIQDSIPYRPGSYTVATKPTAATHPSCLIVVTDPSAGKGRLCYSDGSVWRYVSDDSAV